MDSIIIKGLKLHANHGVNPDENEFGQWFVLDIEAELDLTSACASDRLKDTVSYADIIKSVTSVMQSNTFSLLECAAQSVIDRLFSDLPLLSYIKLTLKKPDAPINAEFDYVGVRIERSRL